MREKKRNKRQNKNVKQENDALIDKQLLLPGNERKAKKILKLLVKKGKKQQRRTGQCFQIISNPRSVDYCMRLCFRYLIIKFVFSEKKVSELTGNLGNVSI